MDGWGHQGIRDRTDDGNNDMEMGRLTGSGSNGEMGDKQTAGTNSRNDGNREGWATSLTIVTGKFFICLFLTLFFQLTSLIVGFTYVMAIIRTTGMQ